MRLRVCVTGFAHRLSALDHFNAARPEHRRVRSEGRRSAPNTSISGNSAIPTGADRENLLAIGAAFLAGWQAGLYPGAEKFAEDWGLDLRFALARDRKS